MARLREGAHHRSHGFPLRVCRACWSVSVTSGPLTVSLAAPYILNSNVASQAGIVTRRLCLCQVRVRCGRLHLLPALNRALSRQHQTTFEWIAYTVPSTAASCDHVSQSQIDAICGTA